MLACVFVLIPTLDEGIYARGSVCHPINLVGIAVALLLVYRDCVHSGTETVATSRGLDSLSSAH